jgi:uncharacterized protein
LSEPARRHGRRRRAGQLGTHRSRSQSRRRRRHAVPQQAVHHDAAGGTTNLIFDLRKGRWAKDWSTLAGTNRNCAGGVTPWGTWITGEETEDEGHGWAFEVGDEKGDPTPLTGLGRFSHEAMMVDPDSGYVYETEDASPSGFYRFVPDVPGKLAKGGELYMLKAIDGPENNDSAR